MSGAPYAVGDVVERVYFGSGDAVGLVVVESRAVHNGRASFSGCVPGSHERVWGYDEQVRRVVVPRTASEWVNDWSGGHTDGRTSRKCAAQCGRYLVRPPRDREHPRELSTMCPVCRGRADAIAAANARVRARVR